MLNYINPWRKTKSGAPYYQKSKPRLKSAFADKRKSRIHSRSEFGYEYVIAHFGVGRTIIRRAWVLGDGNSFAVSNKISTGIGICARSWAQANCIAANITNMAVFNNKSEVQGACVAKWN